MWFRSHQDCTTSIYLNAVGILSSFPSTRLFFFSGLSVLDQSVSTGLRCWYCCVCGAKTPKAAGAAFVVEDSTPRDHLRCRAGSCLRALPSDSLYLWSLLLNLFYWFAFSGGAILCGVRSGGGVSCGNTLSVFLVSCACCANSAAGAVWGRTSNHFGLWIFAHVA